MKLPIFRARLSRPEDVVQARQWARAIAAGLGFSLQDQTRIATAVSEIARNAVAYARDGKVQFVLDEIGRHAALSIEVVDAGSGIEHLDAVLGGRYRSNTGLGLGIVGAKRLMDLLEIETSPTGTSVTMVKYLGGLISEQDLRSRAQKAAARLERMRDPDPVEEVQHQNRELLGSLARLREREEELLQANRELRETASALSNSIEEKDVLIREVHHRVKNNLQIINSLISLQSSRSGSPDVRRELINLAGRIRSLSLIHDKLYQGENLARIDLRDYVGELCANLEASFARPGTAITLTCDLCALVLPIDEGINLGLIVNELVTNAYKHAFPAGSGGAIRVTAVCDESSLTLSVSDDGAGITATPPVSQRPLGMMLVQNMVARLGGEMETDTAAGTRVTVTIPLPEAIQASPVEN